MISSKIEKFLLLLMLISQVCLVVYYGQGKQGLFIDEWWSYNISNATNFIFGDASSYVLKIIPQNFWLSAVTVQPDDAFNFAQVWKNSAIDVHPPLYYGLLHFVSSFTPTHYSIWQGLVINIFFFVLSQYILYKIAKILFEDRLYRLLVVFLFGFSIGVFDLVLTIRMYMLLTFTTLACLWLNLRVIQTEDNKVLSLIAMIHVFGLLTNYCYAVFAFVTSLFVGLHFLFNKKMLMLIKFIFAGLFSLLFSYIIFPNWVAQFFGTGYRGREALGALFFSDLTGKIDKYWDLLQSITHVKEFYLVLAVFFCFCMVIKGVNLSFSKKENTLGVVRFSFNGISSIKNTLTITIDQKFVIWLIVILNCITTFILIAKTSPYISFRYICPVLPMTFLIVTGCVQLCIKLLTNDNRYKLVLISVLCLLSVNFIPQTKQIEWYTPQVAKFYDFVNSKENMYCLGVIPDKQWRMILRNGSEYQQCEKTLLVTESDLNQKIISSIFTRAPDVVILSYFFTEQKKQAIASKLELLWPNHSLRELYKYRGPKGWCFGMENR